MTLDRYRTPAWSWLTGPVRAQLDESAHRQSVTVDFDALPVEAADRYADLLGLRARPSGRTRVNLTRVNTALQATPNGIPLIMLLEALDGPLQNRRAQREETRTARANVWVAARAHPALVKHPVLAAWVDEEQAQASRLPADAGHRRDIIIGALDVSNALPTPGIGRARLAWQVLRDTKALATSASDQHRRACALRAVAAIAERPVPSDLASERELWELVGVSVDPLSSRVLVAGLAPGGDHAVAQSLRVRTGAGLASVLTLADVEAWLPNATLASLRQAYVCENPEVVLAALHELGEFCPMLICTEGRPHLAAVRLIAALIDAGCCVKVHADFDWDGVSIASTVTALGAEPWCMSDDDYGCAVRAAAVHDRPLPALTGKPRPSPWCPELHEQMRTHEIEVHEEDDGVLAALLDDLRAVAAKRGNKRRRASSRRPNFLRL